MAEQNKSLPTTERRKPDLAYADRRVSTKGMMQCRRCGTRLRVAPFSCCYCPECGWSPNGD